ncbi:hypothetical protein FRC11_000989 [Ceratobasidium sp. 423]|nr:hypothetical protein FRC11_000989 [Ceratobasidium sp. 423]
MPTYAGYLMTRQQKLEWLRRAHPEIQADEKHIPATRPLFDLIHKQQITSMFDVEMVIVPGTPDTLWVDGNINPNRMGLMFVRRTLISGPGVWLPPQEIPGVARDILAGKYLKKCGLVISDWVVIHVSDEDPFDVSWVPDPGAGTSASAEA